MRLSVVLLCLLSIAYSGFENAASSTEPPPDQLNPEGSPWGPPADPQPEPEMVTTIWGVALVHTRGYSEVSLQAIEETFYEAAKVCEPEPGAFQVQIYIEPVIFKIDGRWSAGVTDGQDIWVVGYYEAWDGRIARYDEVLLRELVEHVLECEGQEESAGKGKHRPDPGKSTP